MIYVIDEKILSAINSEKHLDRAIELNDYLANNPELGGKEYNSSKHIVELLKDYGLSVEYPFAGLDTSFKASIKGRSTNGPKVCILTEYDALPDIGHGCGHCASGSISVLAGLILNDLKDSFDGQIDIVGTPDEEATGKKVFMAEAGVFNEYDYAIMIHMFNRNMVNAKFLALNSYRIEFFGKTTHAAASPWEGKNALNAAQLFFHATDMMRQHVKPDIRLHGIIKDGGTAANVVPDYTMSEFYIRGNSSSYTDEITEWVKDCAKGAAMSTRTEEKITELAPPFRDLSSNSYAENTLEKIFNFYGLETSEIGEAEGSSDVGAVDQICPTFHPMICVNKNMTLHTREFAGEMLKESGHNAIGNGGKIIATFVMKTFLDPELLKNIKEEHKKSKVI
jgi:amidohydrolase